MFSKIYSSVFFWIFIFQVEGLLPIKESKSDPCASSSRKGFVQVIKGLSKKKYTDRDFIKFGLDREDRDQLKEALMCYNKAIEKNSLEANYYSTRAKCHQKLQDRAAAIEDLNMALSLAPESVKERILLSQLLVEEKKFREAIWETRLLGDRMLCELGKKLMSLNEYDAAARCFSRAIVQNKSEVSYYILRGDCHAKLNDLYWAVRDYKEVRIVDPKNRSGHARLTEVLFEAGEYQELIKETIALDDPEELGKLSEKFFAEKKFKEALSCCNMAIEKNSSEVSYYIRRGDCHLELNNLEEALKDYKQVRVLDPKNDQGHAHLTEALFNAEKYEELMKETIALDDHKELAKLGRKFFLQNKFDEALRCYNEAIIRNDEEAEYYKLRRDCHMEMQNGELAISDFKKAISVTEDKLEDRILLIRLLLIHEKFEDVKQELFQMTDIEVEKASKKVHSEKRFEEAIVYYTEAIKRSSNNSLYYGNRGDCYLQLQKFDWAADDLKMAVNLAGDRLDYRLQLIEALFNAGRFKDCIQETIAFDDTGTYLMALGGKLFTMEEYDDAIFCYSEAINKNPEKEHWYYLKRGICHKRMNNFELAIPDFRKAVTIAPHVHNGRVLLTEALLYSRRFDEATEEMKELEEIELFELADEFVDEGKLEQALQCCNEIIRRDSTEEVHYRMRGNILQELGHLDDAKADIEKALKEHPDSCGCWLDLGGIFYASRDFDGAKNALAKVDKKELTPEDRQKMEILLEKMSLTERGAGMIDVQRSMSLIDM